MHLPPRKPSPRSAWMVLPGLLLLAALLTGLAPLPSEAPSPVPSGGATVTTPDKQETEGETLRVPGREAESEHLFLAVVNDALELVDTKAVVAAVEQAGIGPGKKILLGVDREPSTMKSPTQLIRGMLLFGDSDALADDWVKSGKTKGYLGDGWIAVGVILPATAGDPVRVAVEPGRNMLIDAPGGTEEIAGAGAEAFARGDYTRGLSEVAVAAGQGMHPKFNAIPWLITAGVIPVLWLSIAGLLKTLRRKSAAARTERQARAHELQTELDAAIPRVRELALRLRRPSAAGILAERFETLLAGLDERLAADTELASTSSPVAGSLPGQGTLVRLAHATENLGNVGSALTDLAVVLSGGGQAYRILEQQITAHRERLQEAANGLDAPNAHSLAPAQPLRNLIIVHTRELDELRESSAAGGKRGLAAWDRCEKLRLELVSALSDFVQAARRTGTTLPESVGVLGLPLGFSSRERVPAEREFLERLELAARYLGATSELTTQPVSRVGA